MIPPRKKRHGDQTAAPPNDTAHARSTEPPRRTLDDTHLTLAEVARWLGWTSPVGGKSCTDRMRTFAAAGWWRLQRHGRRELVPLADLVAWQSWWTDSIIDNPRPPFAKE